MLCDDCKKNQATYHSIKKINCVSTEKHLCYECHMKQAEKDMGFSDIGELFSGFKNLFGLPTHRSVARCSKCGTTADEFLDTGFVGCPNCYNDLSSVIMPVVSKVQNDTRHVGKTPDGGNKGNEAAAEYEELRRQLDLAIESERYEDASVIRDRMRNLRGLSNE